MIEDQKVLERRSGDVTTDQTPSTESEPQTQVLPVSAVTANIRQDAVANPTSYVANVKALKGGE